MSETAELFVLALPAGIVGFAAAPCCGLLAPAYVPYALGATGSDSAATDAASPQSFLRSRALRAALMFMLGFALFFTILGATATALGEYLIQELDLLLQIAGIYVVLLGLALLFSVRIPLLTSNKCVNTAALGSSPIVGFGLGFSFAIAWTPCTGPTLGSILALAASSEDVWHGSALLFVYSIGLGVPFLLMTLGLSKARRALGFLQRHAVAVQRTGGVMLVFVGVLIVMGGWSTLLSPLTRSLTEQGWPPI